MPVVAMRVVVKVRSVTLSIEVGHGRQTFLWLANQAQTSTTHTHPVPAGV